MKYCLYLFILVFLLTGCGRKGALIPPEGLAPAEITDLKVEQQGKIFRLSWSAPGKEEAGSRLTDLAGFLLYKRELLPSGEDCESCPTAYRLDRTVDLAYLQGVQRFGNRFVAMDPEIRVGTGYRYKVLAFKEDGTRGRESQPVSRRAVPPPPPPLLNGESSSLGVLLEVTPAPLPAGETLLGVNIYRHKQGEAAAVSPLNPQPVRAATFEDQRITYGATYVYQARTLALTDGEQAESDLSAAVTITPTPPD